MKSFKSFSFCLVLVPQFSHYQHLNFLHRLFPHAALIVFAFPCSFRILQLSSSAWSTPSSISWCTRTTAWLPSALTCRSTCGGRSTWRPCSWWASPFCKKTTCVYTCIGATWTRPAASPGAVPAVPPAHGLQPVHRVRLPRLYELGGVRLLRHPHRPLQ